jgi:hypothetical protein
VVHKVSTTLWYSGAVVEAILGMKLQVTVREKTHKFGIIIRENAEIDN